MTVKTGQLIVGQFVTRDADGYLKNADALPVGTLIVDGANNGAVVTIANVSTGVYSRSVTLPALTAGQTVQVRIAYTVDTVTSGGVVWQDMADTKLTSDLVDPAVATIQSGLALQASVDDLEGRLTSTRAGYLDNLSAGAVATASALVTHDGKLDTVHTDIDAILADTGTDGVVLKAAGLATDAVTEIAAGVRGTGSSTHVVTVTDGTNPLDGVAVVISTDTAGSNKVASGTTGTLGTVTFYLDPGTYYAWMQLSGYNFSNPGTVTVV